MRTFEDIVSDMVRICNRNFYRGYNYEQLPKAIIECATKIYIKELEATNENNK